MIQKAGSATTENPAKQKEPCGAVLVCGGGIAGIQASLDLAGAGFRVYLVEESPTIGGRMARLDKTFPTGDCATCILSPKLVECLRNLNIEIFPMSDITALEGEAGQFTATVRQRPTSVNAEKCTGCGDCWAHCPVRNLPQETGPFRPTVPIEEEEQARLEAILARYEGEPGSLLPILQEVQDSFSYLPRSVLEALSVRQEIPLSEILRVATFYNSFSLEPVGRHLIEVCLGTACFVRGAGTLLERLEKEIGVSAGQTDESMRFTLRTVRCIGCCALAPAFRIDGVTFGKMKPDKVSSILEQFE